MYRLDFDQTFIDLSTIQWTWIELTKLDSTELSEQKDHPKEIKASANIFDLISHSALNQSPILKNIQVWTKCGSTKRNIKKMAAKNNHYTT